MSKKKSLPAGREKKDIPASLEPQGVRRKVCIN